MPIPLGVLAVAGAGGGVAAGNAYELLETTVLGSNQASVEFANLNTNYGSTYQHLQLRVVARTERVNDWLDWLILRFNSDSGSNYATHRLFRDDAESVLSSAFTSQTSIVRAFYVAGSTGTTDTTGAGIMDILDPFETTKYTTTRVHTGYLDSNPSNEGVVALMSGLWMNTNAVTTITLSAGSSANIVSGSRFSLYGLRSS